MSTTKLGFKKIQKKVAAVTGTKKFQPALFVAAVAVIGTVFILASQAATPVTSFQAEAGTRSGNVTTVTDATASAGSAVKFGTVTSGGGIPVAANFPTPQSVGPQVEPTVAYAGDCYFDASESGLVIDGRILDCEAAGGVRFAVDATNIVFRNSIIKGQMFTVGNDPTDPGGQTYPRAPVFTVERSRVTQRTIANDPGQDRAACCSHYVIRDSLIQGSHSVLAAHNNVVLEGNYIATDGTSTHQSGLRMFRNSILRGNTVSCTPVGIGGTNPSYDASGCSAHAVFYRERLDGTGMPAYNLTIENNYFKRGVTAGGQLAGPYYATRFVDCQNWDDCINIRFTGNLFSLGEGTDGGEFPNDAGDVWSGNYWTDGQPANSGQNR